MQRQKGEVDLKGKDLEELRLKCLVRCSHVQSQRNADGENMVVLITPLALLTLLAY
jgi:hypothetical protein